MKEKFLKDIQEIRDQKKSSFYQWLVVYCIGLVLFMVMVATRSSYAMFGFMFFAWISIMQYMEVIYLRRVHRDEYIKQKQFSEIWGQQFEEWRRRARK